MNSDLTNLDFVRSFPLLQQLDCSFTRVSELSPLSGLIALQTLHCSGTRVSELSPLSGLIALQTLNCSDTGVSELSPLSGLIALQTLHCSRTRVLELSPLSGLIALQTLHCSGTRVSELSPLSGLIALQTLHCSRTGVLELSPLSGLIALQTLHCSGTRVSELSPLSGLIALQTLHCSRTGVSELSPLSGLIALQTLNCSGTGVSELSPLSGLIALQTLNCSRTGVSELSPLSGLIALQTLDCSGTGVAELSPLSGLIALQTLHCSGTGVLELSPLSGLIALQTLHCFDTRVSELSPLSGLIALQTLNCSGTGVSELSPLSGLIALQTLNCSRTRVSELSPLSGLIALQTLNCSGCRLDSLPSSLVSSPSLQELILYGCHVSGLPATGVLSQAPWENCLDAVRAHFADLEAGAMDAGDFKLVLLGNGNAGKTQIARWIAEKPFESEWNSTHGIQIGTAPLSGNPPIRLHIWDFGGQDIYHGTHALFLRSPAVMMPVWAADTEKVEEYEHGGLPFRNYPLDYWIDVVRYQGHPASPVLIVQSKCDRAEQEMLPFPIREQALRALPYRKQLHLSAKENRGRAFLEAGLRDAVAWLRDPARFGIAQIGVVRLRVQRRLEALRDADMALPCDQRQHRLLQRQAFEAICAEEGGVASTEHLLTYLDANGIVLYRPGLFDGGAVLDQAWALDAIYAVFDRTGPFKEIRRAGGRFRRSQLGYSVWQRHSDAEQKLFLGMMRSCGICFLHRRSGDDDDEGEYIAPALLQERDAVAAWLPGRWDQDSPSETAIFRYALLHDGLVGAVMSDIGQAAGPDALYWQGGVCGFETKTGSRLLIEQKMTGPWQGEIRIQAQRGQAVALLDQLAEMLEKAQAHLGMQPVSVERSSALTEKREEAKMEFGQEKSVKPEWYVSYAWGDKTSEGLAREKIVDDLCAAAEGRGLQILRDKNVLGLGDSISAFMRRIGAGNRVFVILSDKYLRSPYCMFELSEIWRTSKQEGVAFLDRVRVYTIGDADIWKPISRARYAAYWKKEHDELEAFVRDNGGSSMLGERDFAAFRRMGEFYRHVGDMLATLADIVQPRSFEDLVRYGFDDSPG